MWAIFCQFILVNLIKPLTNGSALDYRRYTNFKIKPRKLMLPPENLPTKVPKLLSFVADIKYSNKIIYELPFDQGPRECGGREGPGPH